MANQSYLLSATVSGIKSIEKPVTINFYKKIVGRNFNPEKYRVKAIYGENGAGKSAIITAFSIFKNLLIDEDYLADSNNQRLLKELINKKLKRFWLECEYLIEDNEELHIYRYQIELKLNEKDRYEITYEHLESRNGKTSRGKYKEIFASKNGELNIIDSDSHDILTKISYNLLGIRSIVSIFFTNINQFLNKKAGRLEYALLFCIVLGLRIQVYLENEDRHELYFLKKKFLEELDKEEVSSEFVEYLRNYIESIGVNEKSVRVELFEGYQRKVNDLYKFIKLFKKDLQSIEIDKKENGEYYECELIFDYGNYKIAREFESTGIKKLVNLFDSLLKASNGFIVFIDEMDCCSAH